MSDKLKETVTFIVTIASFCLAIYFKQGILTNMFGAIGGILLILNIYYVIKIKIDWIRNVFK